jgi:putative NADPH-quinone reductase
MNTSTALKKLTARKSLLVINGHPDPSPQRFCAAISRACIDGAKSRGWNTTQIDTGLFRRNATGADFLDALKLVGHAAQLVVVFPLWLDAAPCSLQAFFDEVDHIRSGEPDGQRCHKKSAHLIVTMTMPAFAMRALAREEAAGGPPHPFSLTGVRAERQTFIGNADLMTDSQRRTWLERIRNTATCEPSTWRRLASTARQFGEMAAR